MAMRKRSGSGSKRYLKEKVVQIYESFFKGEDLISDNPSFWDEFFLLKPKIPQLEEEIVKLSPEQLMNMKDNINLLVFQGIEMLGQEHHMRLLYALQTLSAVFVTMYQKVVQDQTLHIKTLLFGEDADDNMQKLLEYCNQVLSGDGPDSAKAMMLKLMLVIVTGFDSIDENPLVEYFVKHPIFDSLVKLLCTTNERQQHGTDVVTLLMFLINYKKQEPTKNPYVVKLSILDNEFALTGYGQVINLSLNDFITEIFSKLQNNNNAGSGWLSSLTSMVGGIFLGGDETQIVGKRIINSGDESMLLALYEIAHINRNFMATLGHAPASASAPPSPPSTLPHHQNPPDAAQIEALDNSQPTNLLFTYFQHCSIVLADTKEHNINKCMLCLITLTCIVEEQFANSMMHDQNLSFKVQLYKKPMRHRKFVLEEARSQPLASTLIDLVVEFLKCHLRPKEFPGTLYALCVGVLQRVLCYQRRARVRLARDWRPLWAALIALVKFLLDNEQSILPTCNIFVLSHQIVNIFNLFITFGDTFLPTPIAYDLLYYELIRMSDVFDNLSFMAHRVAMSDGEHKQDALRLANSLVNVRAIGHHFSGKIAEFLNNKSLSTPSEDDILEVVRKNYDSLILKLQEGLEGFEQYCDDDYRIVLEQLRLRATRDTRRVLATAVTLNSTVSYQ